MDKNMDTKIIIQIKDIRDIQKNELSYNEYMIYALLCNLFHLEEQDYG